MPFKERVAHFVFEHYPYAYCFSCLAKQLEISEPEGRSTAQILVLRDGYRAARRVCYLCQRTDDSLVFEKAGK
jgi:hypothetical protein